MKTGRVYVNRVLVRAELNRMNGTLPPSVAEENKSHGMPGGSPKWL